MGESGHFRLSYLLSNHPFGPKTDEPILQVQAKAFYATGNLGLIEAEPDSVS